MPQLQRFFSSPAPAERQFFRRSGLVGSKAELDVAPGAIGSVQRACGAVLVGRYRTCRDHAEDATVGRPLYTRMAALARGPARVAS